MGQPTPRVVVTTALVATLALGLIANGCSDTDCASSASCAGAGVDGSFPEPKGDGGTDVDRCIDTPTDPSCLDEAVALFVSAANGDDAGDGSRAKPFKSLGAALAKISPTKKRIFLCEGTYKEDIVLGKAHNGLSLFGGLTCDWKPSSNKPILGKGALPLKIEAATGLAIADLAFVAKDVRINGASSIAAWVRSAEVTFKRVNLVAAKATAGSGGFRVDFTFPVDHNGNNVVPASFSAGEGDEKLVTCPDGSVTKGGRGGASDSDGAPGEPGPDNRGTVTECKAGTPVGVGGRDGQPGTTPEAAAGATRLGVLAEDGWRPQAGADGKPGTPGQGGGGGAGLYETAGLHAGTGGGGGAGGCGGAGGAGGKGGGASIALASLHAAVKLFESTLTTDSAGSGGNGTDGQPGQSGGSGGLMNPYAAACQGGNGGAGGNGAAGGGGAGGVSVGVLYKGLTPTLDEATTNAIKLGKLGPAGAGPGNAGIDGVAQPILEVE